MRRLSLVLAAACAMLLCAQAQAAAKKKPAAAAKKAPAVKAPSLPNKGPDEVSVPGGTADASGAPTPPTRGPTRIDFDDRLIQGQTNKSGAVYLYDRKELKTRSMIRKRESFREEIIDSLYDS
jgi:hypothetical protein